MYCLFVHQFRPARTRSPRIPFVHAAQTFHAAACSPDRCREKTGLLLLVLLCLTFYFNYNFFYANNIEIAFLFIAVDCRAFHRSPVIIVEVPIDPWKCSFRFFVGEVQAVRDGTNRHQGRSRLLRFCILLIYADERGGNVTFHKTLIGFSLGTWPCLWEFDCGRFVLLAEILPPPEEGFISVGWDWVVVGVGGGENIFINIFYELLLTICGWRKQIGAALFCGDHFCWRDDPKETITLCCAKVGVAWLVNKQTIKVC